MPNTPTVVSVSSRATSIPLLAQEQLIFRLRPALIIPLSFILFIWAIGGLFLWALINFNVLDGVPIITPRIFTIIFVATLAFVGLAIFLSWLNTEYILTNQRVEWRFGILGEKVISIALGNIENITVGYNILGRIFNYGDLKIEPAGIGTIINFKGITRPEIRKRQIENSISP